MTFDVGVTSTVISDDLHEAIERAAAAGADAIEFYDFESVDIAAVRETAADNGIAIGGTLAAGVGSNIGDADGQAISYPSDHAEAVADIERSIEAASRLGADSLIVTVGQRIDTLSETQQHRAIVSVLREVAPMAEAHDVTIVPETLNTRVDHPGYFLETADQGFAVVDAVDSPNVKLLFDIYHQQVTEGNIIQTMTEHLDLIGHVHIADVPGRQEPGTGELNYEQIFAALVEHGYAGIVACEFGASGEPDEAVEHVVELADRVR